MYKINGLVHHALNAIDQFGKDLIIAQILDAVCEVYAQLPEDEVWLPKYLKAQLETAFKQDRGIFGREEFMKHIGNNATWTQFLVKIMADILAEKSLREQLEPDQHAAEQLREEDFEVLPLPRVICGNVDAENWPSPSSMGKEELTPDSEHLSVHELLPEVPMGPKKPAEPELEPEPELEHGVPTLASLDGRTFEENGDILDDDGQVIGRLVGGGHKLSRLIKAKAKCDAEGRIWAKGKQVLSVKVEVVIKKPVVERSVCPERILHVFGYEGGWKTCWNCRCLILEMADQLSRKL